MQGFFSLSRQSIGNTLMQYVPPDTFPKKPRVVSIGCADFMEYDIFKRLYGSEVYGVEIRAEAMQIAQTLHPFSKKHFIHGDGRDLQHLVEGSFDLIIARHPNVKHDPWSEIYPACNATLADDGFLFTTLYHPHEIAPACEQIEGAGFDIVACEPNSNSRQYESHLHRPPTVFHLDHYAILARKLQD